MAIDKIQTAGLGENIEIGGTEAAKMPVGTTAQRANVQAGDIRFNSSTALMEYYDGTQWKSIDSPPSITSISPSNIADTNSSVDITINGNNFIIGGQTVTAIGSDGSTITAGTVTRNSNTQLTANFDGTSFLNAQEPYDIKIENNASGLSIVGSDVLNVNASPAWTVSSGSLGTVYDSARTGVSFTTGATDSEGATLTYSLSVGSLPSGLTLNTANGTISGNADAVGSDTTSTFTLSVTDGTNTVTRQYSITINAPTIVSYTSTGSGTFSVPSGISAVDVLVVAGGGGGASYYYGAGGGAGGLIYRPAFPVTPGGSVSYSVGGGASGIPFTPGAPQTSGLPGQNSTFGTLTAIGGGGGSRQLGQAGTGQVGQSGGSGGGGSSYHGGSQVNAGGTGTQPQQPGDSGTYGFGNPGGSSDYGSGGGGGAGGAGGNAPNFAGGAGGIGKQYDISGSQVYYAGGGGGAGDANGSPNQGGTGGQGGGGSITNDQSTPGQGGGPAPLNAAQQGAVNRGGGGAGGYHDSGVGQGGAGGSGIVIVKY